MNERHLEISDVIVSYDASDPTVRLPVSRSEAVERFRALGNRRAARIVSKLPEVGGVLDPDAVDALMVRVHTELQRLHEEFQHGRRVCRWLVPLINAIRAEDATTRIRIVDIGCGLGFVIRWLAARGELGPGVELCGIDFNQGLIAAATKAANAERLDCQFVVGNAFELSEPATIYMSTGVIHHFRGDDLEAFLAPQAKARAFVHWDIAQTWLAPIGAWIFHQARMREPLSKHDGVYSALRAHTDSRLLEAARQAAPTMRTGIFDTPNRWLPVFKVLRPLVGFQPALEARLRAGLGRVSKRIKLQK